MQKETIKTNSLTSPLQALRIARQVRAIKRSVLHNVEHGTMDVPAHGILHIPGKTYKLHNGSVDSLNKQLAEYDVRVDAYKMKVRNKLIDRVVVTHVDNKLVEPSPAYQSALQSRHFAAVV